MIILISHFCHSQERLNVIVMVNGQVLEDGCCNFKLEQGDEFYDVRYIPGELRVLKEVYKTLSTDTSTTYLAFDYYRFDKNKSDLVNFKCPIILREGITDYQILEVYDLREKKYRDWYSTHTEEEFLCENRFPGSGRYIRNE